MVYDALAKAVCVSTLRLGTNGAWTLYAGKAATFATGDVLKARALATGDVQLFKNGTLITTVTLNSADKSFFNAKGGKIGIWTALAPKTVLDDFGGGTVAASTQTFNAAISNPPASTVVPEATYRLLLPIVGR